jgi:tight adherence protein B
MKLLAALSMGCFVALVVGRLVGLRVSVRRPQTRRRLSRIDRSTWLAQSGSSITPTQFWMGSVLIGLVVLLIVGALAGSVAVALVPAGACAILPRSILAKRRSERLALLRNAWPDGLRDIVTSIAAGASITHALELLAKHGPEPLRESFGRFPTLARMLGTSAALEVIREELADPTTDRVVEVLVLAHERGGTIVRTVLEDLARATTRDVRLAEEIRTEGLEMRINARSVVVLPWALLVLLCIRPGPFRDFYGTGRGALVLAMGAALSAVGMMIVRKLARVEDEPRVFGERTRSAA